MKKKRAWIVYHGTNAVSARRILKEGFDPGTYFGIHLEDALGYGGRWVFEVVIPSHLIPKGSWQYITEYGVLPEFIVSLTRYRPAEIRFNNEVLRHMVCISNESKGETEYIRADMKKNPGHYSEAELIAYGIKRGAT